MKLQALGLRTATSEQIANEMKDRHVFRAVRKRMMPGNESGWNLGLLGALEEIGWQHPTSMFFLAVQCAHGLIEHEQGMPIEEAFPNHGDRKREAVRVLHQLGVHDVASLCEMGPPDAFDPFAIQLYENGRIWIESQLPYGELGLIDMN